MSAFTDSPLLAKAERDRIADEARHDQTRQRRFERSFESRDMPGSKAALSAASDNGRGVWRVVREVDRATLENARTLRINRAAARLPRSSPFLRRLLWAIYRNGKNREETMAELDIPRGTYWWGVKFLLNFYSAQ